MLDPGRSRESEKNREEGASAEGVMLNKLEEKAAPSATSDEPDGIWEEMYEFRGRASPRIPLNEDDSGSSLTVVAEAAIQIKKVRQDI